MKRIAIFLMPCCLALNTSCEEETGVIYSMDPDDTEDSSADGDTETETFTPPLDAVNICVEEVPLEHYVDGIPAFGQCADSQDGAIWSDNGLNTSASQEDAGWVRTQWSMGYQCTEFAHRYLHFVWDVTSVPNGNAGEWCNDTPPDGLVKTSYPVHGDIMVFAPGSCGASQVYGHVGVVDVVDTINDTAEFVEQNPSNRRSCPISTAACFLHAEGNTAS